MNAPTLQQRLAIEARGNVLVAAGAGAGKTRTLIDRSLAWILGEERGSVDEILMVTFTEAAATEMRQRLRQGLESALETNPSARLLEQMALLETAHISTLHSFCFHLVSQHVYELKTEPGGDPTLEGPLTVLSAERSKLLSRQAMDVVLDQVYEDKLPGAAAIQDLIRAHGDDWDKPTREMVHRLHDYRQSLRDPDGWLAAQRARFSQAQPLEWTNWLMDALHEWRRTWLNVLAKTDPKNTVATESLKILRALAKDATRAEYAAALEAVGESRGQKGSEEIAEFRKESKFLHSVAAEGGRDPLQEDWDWSRPPMLALLNLTEAFGQAYARSKRAVGGVDFQDLEQLALRLLWRKDHRTNVAEQWRKKFRLIFVDEFQDINEAQDEIIRALGREGAESNRFLVGDVKQSIYRFRLADPGIFQRREREWKRGAEGVALALTENFRSHEDILEFANGIFSTLMRSETSGGPYDKSVRLVFGDRANRTALASTPSDRKRVEIHLRTINKQADEEEENAGETELEARMIGARLRELKNAGTSVNTKDGVRPIEWSDMAALLRSPLHKVESYVKAFASLGVPIVAARTGFYDTLEARDLLSLLRILDNPLQDLPLLGVLRSPFAAFTSHDLALVRIGREGVRYWKALEAWHKNANEKTAPLYRKAGTFLTRFKAWRGLARQNGVSRCLESALDETHYTAWLGASERSGQRRANVERFLQLTREFDAERGEGLSKFLSLVEAQQDHEIDIEPGSAPTTNAVRLMSIHQSKGLEFPVVALGDLGKRFNMRDATGRLILDTQLGLCPQIKPPGARQFYPSLAHWLAQRRQKRETLAEEMRLLYVALTRPVEWLILAGSITEKANEKWERLAKSLSEDDDSVWEATNVLDWIGACLSGPESDALLKVAKMAPEWDEPPVDHLASETTESAVDLSAEAGARLEWKYPASAATEQAAKTSVSALRQRSQSEEDEEAQVWFAPRSRSILDAADVGSAHHAFLEAASLEKLATPNGIAEEVARLRATGQLSETEIASLDLEALNAFWQSDTGRQLLAQRQHLQRELAFTARFPAEIFSDAAPAEKDGDFVVVQGAVDLAAILPGEIWIVDFKTERFPAAELEERIAKHRPQLAIYAFALARIYQRPVTRSWIGFLSQRQIVLL